MVAPVAAASVLAGKGSIRGGGREPEEYVLQTAKIYPPRA